MVLLRAIEDHLVAPHALGDARERGDDHQSHTAPSTLFVHDDVLDVPAQTAPPRELALEHQRARREQSPLLLDDEHKLRPVPRLREPRLPLLAGDVPRGRQLREQLHEPLVEVVRLELAHEDHLAVLLVAPRGHQQRSRWLFGFALRRLAQQQTRHEAHGETDRPAALEVHHLRSATRVTFPSCLRRARALAWVSLSTQTRRLAFSRAIRLASETSQFSQLSTNCRPGRQASRDGTSVSMRTLADEHDERS